MNAKSALLGLSPGDKGRMEDVRRLTEGGDGSVDALVAMLTDPSWAVRRAVVSALARIGTAAVGPLVALLQGDRRNESALAGAVDALVASSGDVEPALLALVESNPDEAILCDAAQVLGRRKSRIATDALAALVQHTDDNVAVAAIEALGRIGGSATIEPLVHAVASGNFFRTFPAIAVLGHTGDARAVAPLAALLGEPHYAGEAIAALGSTGQISAAAPLAGLLAHPADPIVRASARALLDVRRAHAARFGGTEAVTAALRSAMPADAAARMSVASKAATAADRVALASVLGWMRDASAVTSLVALIETEPAHAADAVEALRLLGPEADPWVREAMVRGNSERRARLLPLLGARRANVAELTLCLADPDAVVRALACDALGRTGSLEAVPALFDLLVDEDLRVAQAAAGALQSLGSEETKRRAIEAAAPSTNVPLRRAALRIVSYFGYAEGLDVLAQAVVDADDRIRDAATLGLALLEDPRALAALLEALKHPVAATRASAARALARAIPTRGVADALGEALRDSDPWVRYYACQSIGKLRLVDAASAVCPLIDDPAGQVRVAAVEALAKLGGQRALELLEGASRNADPDLRRAALIGLGQLERPAAFAILVAAAESADAETRLIALGAIAASSAPEADRALIQAASDPDDGVRHAALELLGSRGGDVTRWLIDRLAFAADREPILLALTTQAEGRIEAILGALQTADTALARLLVQTLLGMQRPNGTAAVEAALLFDNVHARRAAATGLVGLGTPRALAALALAAESDSDSEVRRISGGKR